MSFFDRLLGREPRDQAGSPTYDRRTASSYAPGSQAPRDQASGGRAMGASAPDSPEQALERYRYMLRTAPPEDIERAHEEAFAALSPEQRQQVLQALAQEVPQNEVPQSDDPRSLARMATRAEIRRPGTVERALGPGTGGGVGMGMPGLGSMLLYSLAGSFIGTAIAQSFFDNDPGFTEGQAGSDFSGGEVQSAEYAEGGFAEGEGEEVAGDSGGDFGGGDFGGGDFGGGDFGGDF